jgi:hypothetical protein
MAKKTTKTPAKTATKKPVTMAERVKRIELDVNRHGASMAVQMSAMREHVDLLHEDTIAQIESNRVRLIKIERLLSTPQDVTGTPVDIKVTIPEQGLEPGDYTDASKKVADALTAMGFKWIGEWRNFHAYIRWIKDRAAMVSNCAHSTSYTKFTPATFLSRAAVTAKKLGLVAKEEEPWKPEVGELVVCECDDFPETCPRGTIGPVICLYPNGAIDMVGLKGGSRHMYPKERRKPTPEEVAKYHADKEAAKPIGPYVTRVMCDGYEWRVICGMDQLKRYRIHRIEGEFEYCVSVQRHEFTVID